MIEGNPCAPEVAGSSLTLIGCLGIFSHDIPWNTLLVAPQVTMMLIGNLAERAGVSTRTIRYYEELGMIQPEERTAGGFRRYSDEQLRRLTIIDNLKSLGFELERIRQLFALRHSMETGGKLADSMIGLLYEQQSEIDRKIGHYMAMKKRNAKGIEVLQDCLSCSIPVFDRDCHNCDIYRQHEAVPDLIECAIYGT